jgi:DNA polymerase III sliding clamp (beta) subunit (PCNA family)
LDARAFLQAVNSVQHAAAVSFDAKPAHHSILLDGDGETLNFVACDGFRLSRVQMPFEHALKFLIPADVIGKLHSFFENKDTITITTAKNKAKISCEDRALYFGALDASGFMNWRDVFTKAGSSSTAFGRKSLLPCVQRAVAAMESKIKVPIAATLQGTKMTVEGKSAWSDFSESVDLSAPVEGAVCIGLNPRFLVESLRSMRGDDVQISFGNAIQPILLSAGEHQEIILPVRLKADD